MKAIETVKLTKKYKELTAVDALDLSIDEGSVFGLLGVNGAGKTTTIKMLSCLCKPTSGEAYVLGHSVTKESMKVKEIISVSPQETAVAANLSVFENLEMMYGVYGHTRQESKDKANEFIKKFSFEEIRKSKAKTLSGGYQRRLSIAMALISDPKILFLDEPTLGLDVLARRELWRVIEELKNSITIVLTTHYLEEAEALSDRIAIMTKSKLRAVGSAQELKEMTGTDKFEDAFIKIAEGV